MGDETEMLKRLEELVKLHWINRVIGRRDPLSIGQLESLPGSQTLFSLVRTLEVPDPRSKYEQLKSQVAIRGIYIGPCAFSRYNLLTCATPATKPDTQVPAGLAVAYVQIPNGFGLRRLCLEVRTTDRHGYFPCEGAWVYRQVIRLDCMKIIGTKKEMHVAP